MPAQIIVCIPGPWKDRSKLITEIVSATKGEYIAAGVALLHRRSQKTFEIQVEKRDDNMRNAFAHAGMVNRLSPEFIDTIDQHQSVVYLLGEAGSPEAAASIAKAAVALLQAGGLGVKVETAGKAFSAEQWTALATMEEPDLYRLFVLDSISDGDAVFSCGMHNLGLRDAIVSGEEFQFAAHLLNVFGYYQVLEHPVLKEAQTFSTDADAPVFRLSTEPSPPYTDDELFGNPSGMWRLTRVDE